MRTNRSLSLFPHHLLYLFYLLYLKNLQQDYPVGPNTQSKQLTTNYSNSFILKNRLVIGSKREERLHSSGDGGVCIQLLYKQKQKLEKKTLVFDVCVEFNCVFRKITYHSILLCSTTITVCSKLAYFYYFSFLF